MISSSFKSYLKSRSLGNLHISENFEAEEVNLSLTVKSPSSLSASGGVKQTNTMQKGDKHHNLSSSNESLRNLRMRLKEISTKGGVKANLEPPPCLPNNNIDDLLNEISKEKHQQQSAIWELLITEQNFLRQIHFIIQMYVNTLEDLIPTFFCDLSVSKLFNNIHQVYLASMKFWGITMKPMLEASLNPQETPTIEQFQPFNPLLLKDGFMQISRIFQPYILYCTEIGSCRSNINSLETGNELFMEFSKWAMELGDSNREILCDHLAKPFLRLTKYKLLLSAIQKYSEEHEKQEIQEMVDSVNNFLNQLNEKVEERNLERKIEQINSQIHSYEVIETTEEMASLIDIYCKFNLTSRVKVGDADVVRQLIYQDEIKLRESPNKLIEVKLMLFTDILCIMKSVRKIHNKFKIIRPPLELAKLETIKHSQTNFMCVILNKFECLESLYQFTCSDSSKVLDWIEKINLTKDRLQKLSHPRKMEKFIRNPINKTNSKHENTQLSIVLTSPTSVNNEQDHIDSIPDPNDENEVAQIRPNPPPSREQKSFSKTFTKISNSNISQKRKNSFPNSALNLQKFRYFQKNSSKSNSHNNTMALTSHSTIDDIDDTNTSDIDDMGDKQWISPRYKSRTYHPNSSSGSSFFVFDADMRGIGKSATNLLIKDSRSTIDRNSGEKLNKKISISLNTLDNN